MKVSSVSGFRLLVKDLDKTAKFYEDFGFRFGKREDYRLVVYVNWFSVEFITNDETDKSETAAKNRGAGVWFMVSVLNVDDFYKEVIKVGYKPESEPHDHPAGRRQFIVHDPDGYKLVFFKKK